MWIIKLNKAYLNLVIYFILIVFVGIELTPTNLYAKKRRRSSRGESLYNPTPPPHKQNNPPIHFDDISKYHLHQSEAILEDVSENFKLLETSIDNLESFEVKYSVITLDTVIKDYIFKKQDADNLTLEEKIYKKDGNHSEKSQWKIAGDKGYFIQNEEKIETPKETILKTISARTFPNIMKFQTMLSSKIDSDLIRKKFIYDNCKEDSCTLFFEDPSQDYKMSLIIDRWNQISKVIVKSSFGVLRFDYSDFRSVGRYMFPHSMVIFRDDIPISNTSVDYIRYGVQGKKELSSL